MVAVLSLSVNPRSGYESLNLIVCCLCHAAKLEKNLGKKILVRCFFECEDLHCQRPPRCIDIKPTPMKITDYIVSKEKGIGLKGTDIQGGEVTEDGFTWFSIRSTNLQVAVDAVKEMQKDEKKRIEDNKKLLEGL